METVDLKAGSFKGELGSRQRPLEKLDDALKHCGCAVTVITSRIDPNMLGHGSQADVVILSSKGPGDDIAYVMTNLTRRLDAPVLLYLFEQDDISELVAFRTGATDVLNATMSRAVLTERITSASIRHASYGKWANFPIEAPADLRAILMADVNNNDFWIGDERIEMTLPEVKLLEVLISRRGGVVKREELVTLLELSGRSRSYRAVDSIVKRIRRKMRDREIAADVINTVYGLGYRLSPEFVPAFRAFRARHT